MTPIIIDGISIDKVIANGTQINSVVAGGTVVWAQQLTITIQSNDTACGTVSHSSVTVTTGTPITILGDSITIGSTIVKAMPNADNQQYEYSLERWNVDSFVATTNVTIVARFVRVVKKYTVTFVSADPLMGAVSQDSIRVSYGSLIQLQEDGSIYLNYTPITAIPTAQTPQYAYAFDGWQMDEQSVTRDLTVTASFSRTERTYRIVVAFTGGGSISPQGIIWCAYGSRAAFTVTAQADCLIESIKITGVDIPVTNELVQQYVFENICAHAEIRVVFAKWHTVWSGDSQIGAINSAPIAIPVATHGNYNTAKPIRITCDKFSYENIRKVTRLTSQWQLIGEFWSGDNQDSNTQLEGRINGLNMECRAPSGDAWLQLYKIEEAK